MLTDVKLAFRRLVGNPGFTAVALLTLALSIGTNLTIYAVVDGILWRPLRFSRPEQLIAVYNTYPKTDLGRAGSSFANLYNRKGRIDAFASVAAYKQDVVTVGESGGGQRVEILRVSPDFFATLGIQPKLGRSFIEEEMTLQTHDVAILSHALWSREFSADPRVLGRTIRVNGFSKRIVGVMPADFEFLSSRARLFLPLSSSPDQRDINSLHNSANCQMIARIKPGATLEEAQSQIEANNAAVGRDFPFAEQVRASGFRTIVAPLHDDHVEGIRSTLLLLQAGGIVLLLIGAVNLVNLLLVRACARTREMAIRQSLGASQGRMVRQTLIETALLTSIGSLGGVGVGVGVFGMWVLAGTGLLGVSLKQEIDISPGFQADHVITGQISMLHKNYLENAARLSFAERVVEAVGRQPNLPVGGRESGNQRRVMSVANGRTDPGNILAPNIYGVVGDFFQATGIPLRAGRFFDDAASRKEERVCIVDETFARKNWPDIDPLEQLVFDGPDAELVGEPFRVIGVVGAVKQTELTEIPTAGTLYFPFRDNPLGADSLYVIVRTIQVPTAIGSVLQNLIRGIEPELPLSHLQAMDSRLADTLIMRRSPFLLAGVFSVVALLLAAIGTYGVLSVSVALRYREIGVRMALGALPSQIGWQFFSLGLRLFFAGAVLGIFGAWAAGRSMQSLLFNVPTLQFLPLAGTALILGLVCLLAWVSPALRASRIDPMEALRND